MGGLETFDGKPYPELSLTKAPEFLQGFIRSRFVCAEPGFEPHLFRDPEEAKNYVLQGFLWAPGWEDSTGDWVKFDASWSHTGSQDEDDVWEFLCATVHVPIAPFDEELLSFTDELDDAWTDWVDRLREEGHTSLNWRMHENGLATDSGAACISSEAEDDDTLDIEVEDTPVGHYHDPNTHDGMTREQYGAQIAERLGNLVRTLKEYTPTFIQNEIPKLIKKREERIETKPPAWPVSAISALGAHEVRGEWLEPVEGTEPIEYETGGQVTIDGMVYKIDMKSTDDEENEKGGRIEGMVVFPTEMMSVFGDNDESIGEMIEKFGDYCISNMHSITFFGEALDPENSIGLLFRIAHIEKGDTESVGYNFIVEKWDMRKLVEKGYTREQVLGEIFAIARQFHPYLVSFVNGSR